MWLGDDAKIIGNVFRDNGDDHLRRLWSDGLTVGSSDRALIRGNRFIDHTDVALIIGGAVDGVISENTIEQKTRLAFAAFMLTNFRGNRPGDFTGARISGNTIDCGEQLCHFGMNLGEHAWYPDQPNIRGGTVTGNRILNARLGINIDGAGTQDHPIRVFANEISGSPHEAEFHCGPRPTSNLNINTADSVVERDGDPTPLTTHEWHACP